MVYSPGYSQITLKKGILSMSLLPKLSAFLILLVSSTLAVADPYSSISDGMGGFYHSDGSSSMSDGMGGFYHSD